MDKEKKNKRFTGIIFFSFPFNKYGLAISIIIVVIVLVLELLKLF